MSGWRRIGNSAALLRQLLNRSVAGKLAHPLAADPRWLAAIWRRMRWDFGVTGTITYYQTSCYVELDITGSLYLLHFSWDFFWFCRDVLRQVRRATRLLSTLIMAFFRSRDQTWCGRRKEALCLPARKKRLPMRKILGSVVNRRPIKRPPF